MHGISAAEKTKSEKLHSIGFMCPGADSRDSTGVASVTRIQGLPFARHSHLQFQTEKWTANRFKAMIKIN